MKAWLINQTLISKIFEDKEAISQKLIETLQLSFNFKAIKRSPLLKAKGHFCLKKKKK